MKETVWRNQLYIHVCKSKVIIDSLMLVSRIEFAHRKIRLIESNAKCIHLKKFSCKGTLRQLFICLRPPSLLGFCLRWSSNFVGSEIWADTEC
jgi:hypothetical protein